MKSFITLLVVVVLGVAGYVFWAHRAPGNGGAGTPIATVSYQCNGGKTINAAYFEGASKPPAAPGQPPVPGGSVKLTLSDGRTMTLPQTLSADGIRYSDGDPNVQGSETFVFWSKGNGAFVLEHNSDKTYIGCVRVADDPGGLPQVYENGSSGFSIRYPQGFTVDPNYVYQALGPGKDIGGVKFTIPESMATGTNLGSDTYISVEEIPLDNNVAATLCNAALFLPSDANGMRTSSTFTDDTNTTYSVASTTGAAAGNRYEVTVYAVPGTNPCVAVRYFVHYGVFENYPPGAVSRFDRGALLQRFDAIRKTLIIDQ